MVKKKRSYSFYIDEWSKKYCFDCPLPECVGDINERCPIYKAKRAAADRKTKPQSDRRKRPAPSPEGYVTLAEASEWLDIPVKTLHTWIRVGWIKRERLRQGKNKAYFVPVAYLPDIKALRIRRYYIND